MSKKEYITQSPCFNCVRRNSECHSTCARYISWTKKRNELKKLKLNAELAKPPHRKDDD